MHRQPVLLDWRMIADDEWEQLGAPDERVAGVGRLRAWRCLIAALRGLVLAVAVVALTAASFAPPPAQLTWAYETILPTLQRESQAWATQDEALLDSVSDPLTAARYRNEWRVGWASDEQDKPQYQTNILVAEPVGDLIRVQVRVQQDHPQWWLSSPHRETRFYRQTADGWLRTVPPIEFWGKQRVVETAHLRFEFYDYDFQNVMDVVDKAELAYVRAHGWLGVIPPQGEDKITVALMPDLVRGWGGYGNRLQVTAPALARVPEGMTDGDYLAQQIVGRFSSRVLNQLFDDFERSNTYQWRTMLWALSGWWRTELVGQRAPWHLQAETLFHRHLRSAHPLQLRDIETSYPSWRVDQEEMMLQYMAAESVVTYALNRHGRERLRELVMAFNAHGSWVGLVPSLYDQSPAEFEAAWNQYLAEEYGLSEVRR